MHAPPQILSHMWPGWDIASLSPRRFNMIANTKKAEASPPVKMKDTGIEKSSTVQRTSLQLLLTRIRGRRA
jgi:hypothetical protein